MKLKEIWLVKEAIDDIHVESRENKGMALGCVEKTSKAENR